MKFNKVTIGFETKNIPLAEELISDIFFSLNLTGVVCDIPLEEPDEGFGTNTLAVPEHYSITGYLPALDSAPIILDQIRNKAEKLVDFGIRVDIATCMVDEEDWSHAWKTYFDVMRITDRITVKPLWKTHTQKKGEIVIHLDPGMAFGTGTHPTTAACLKFMDIFFKPGGTFLDVGTGSGILMIAAAKLGADHLQGIDTDEIAVAAARRNLDINRVHPGKIRLSCNTLDQMDRLHYDMITVNIIAQVIVNILPQIAERMAKDSIAILSGIIRDHKNSVLAALEDSKLAVMHEESVDEWVTLAVKRKQDIV